MRSYLYGLMLPTHVSANMVVCVCVCKGQSEQFLGIMDWRGWPVLAVSLQKTQSSLPERQTLNTGV